MAKVPTHRVDALIKQHMAYVAKFEPTGTWSGAKFEGTQYWDPQFNVVWECEAKRRINNHLTKTRNKIIQILEGRAK